MTKILIDRAKFERLVHLAGEEYSDIGAYYQEGGNPESAPDAPEWAAIVAALSSALDAQPEPVAWMDDYGACIPTAMRTRMRADGGASERAALMYSRPLLYIDPPPPAAQPEPVARVYVHRTGGNAGIAWSARSVDECESLPPLADGTKLYAAPPAPAVLTRKDAEQAYTISAFDYVRDPVGSRDWTLFWKGWQAALAARGAA